MPEEAEEDNTAPNEPFFSLEFGANGGTFAPTSAVELMNWVQSQLDFWGWTSGINVGTHKSALDHAIQPLHSAHGVAREATQYESQSNQSAVRERAHQVSNLMQEAYTTRLLPHSTSSIGKRVDQLRLTSPAAAIAYVYPFLSVMPGHTFPFEGREIDSWHGFMQGLFDRFSLGSGAESNRAFEAAVDDLRGRTEVMYAEKKQLFEGLHRRYLKTSKQIDGVATAQAQTFEEFMIKSQGAQDGALEQHGSGMEALRKTFREQMALRSPVEYWESRATLHASKSKTQMKFAFGSLAVLALILGLLATWVFWTLTEGKPDTWKVAVLVLVGVLGVWTVRLIVRMFLSNMHLATDAEERVTMVKTYLSLLESDKIPSDEDRKLILQPLFRPATDGLVKDEGLPHPMLELLTRSSSK